MAEYVHPEVLVSTDWVAQHRNDPNVRIVESDEDILLYDVGHIPGAVKVDWQNELQHQVIRDYVDKDAFSKLVGSKGIGNNHTVVFYGDRNNWWACYALWCSRCTAIRIAASWMVDAKNGSTKAESSRKSGPIIQRPPTRRAVLTCRFGLSWPGRGAHQGAQTAH